MKYTRKNKENEVDQENPVKLPVGNQTTCEITDNQDKIDTFLSALPNDKAIEESAFLEASKQVMENHKGTMEKLRDSDFTDSAFGMFKNKDTGLWSLVEIKYDPLNLTISQKIVETKLTNNDRETAEYRFKILLGETLFS